MNKYFQNQTAKVFWSGRSQAVRIPKDFRFDSDEVIIRREGQKVILEEKPPAGGDRWAWLEKMPGEIEPGFEAAALEDMPWGDDDPESARQK